LLNVLSSFIPNNERIITIEDAAELQLQQRHVVQLESRPANIEGKGAITIRDLVRNTLRMRPNRIIVGECRGGEVLDMLQAMNTGHEGSMSTLHANSPRDALSRMEMMFLMTELDLPMTAVRQMIGAAINVIIQVDRLPGGPRRVTHLTEVTGMEGETITTQDIFFFRQLGIDGTGKAYGQFEATGVRPRFMKRLEAASIALPPHVFQTGVQMRA
jgi:pilus assembly protein CpaF